MTRGYGAPRAARSILACFLALGAVLGAAPGARAGDWDGVPDEVVERLARDLQAGRDAAAEAEALRGQVAALQAQVEALLRTVEELKAAEANRALATALAEDRDKRRQEIEDGFRDLLDRHEKLLAQAMARTESLEKRAFWLQLLAPIVGILGLVAGALLVL